MKIIVDRQTSDKIFLDLGINENTFDKEQFWLGMNIELEHGLANSFTNVTNDDLLMTGKIAYAHMIEIPYYYDYLVEIEKRFEENVNKVVLITGGSEGLGKSIAKELSKICKVIITGVDEAKLKNDSAQMKCDYYVADVTNYVVLKNTVSDIISKYKKIDVLINNAGVFFEGGIEEMKENEITKLIDVNVKGVEYMSNIVCPYMILENSGLIINVVSQSGLYHRRNRSLYNSSKWAITGFTKCLSADLAKFGIKVTGFYPGKMETNIFKNSKTDPKEGALDPSIAAKAIRFIVEMNGDGYLPELGIKSIKQELVDEITY